MQKILIGICGIGNGHINRQICVINELLKHKYKVLIATEVNRINIIKKKFPHENVIELSIPWIVCNENGLNFKESLIKYNNIDIFKKFLEFGINVEKNLNGKPNLIISDYEPNVAQYAYAKNIPLVTMEQQSKFIYLDEINIKNHSSLEEVDRLNYFFPKFDKKIISSFFPITIKNKNIIMVAPIISKLEKHKTKNYLILVYLSPYSNSEKYENIINVIKDINEFTFKVYTKNYKKYIRKYNFTNITYSDFNDAFKKDLSECSALITTGGHQLISEAISLDVPLFVVPLETYEQYYNAYMVNKYKLGTNEAMSKESIINFISNKAEYENNIKLYKKTYFQTKWEKLFIEAIEEILNK